MKLAFGFAGIPSELFDAFRRNQEKLVESGDTIIAQSFRNKVEGFYSKPHAAFFLKEYAKLLADDNENSLSDVGFAVAYVSTHPGAADFAERLFPAIFTIPVDWRMEGHNRTTWGRSLSQLNAELRSAVISARAALPTLKKELIEQDNRTPWLLPTKNFRSDVLRSSLFAVQDELRGNAEPASSLRRLRQNFEHFHPPQKIGSKSRSCFVDNAGVEFHPPGNARHAFARANFDHHPPTCLINGRRRLGSPYARAFHYDCGRADRVLKA